MHPEQKRKKRRTASGFSLVELMVVVAIISILATTVGIYVFGALDDADRSKAQAEIKALKGAVQIYMMKNNRQLPNTLEEVAQYLDPPKVPQDPWGTDYVYTKEGSRQFTILSYGADRASGGSDIDEDISSNDF